MKGLVINVSKYKPGLEVLLEERINILRGYKVGLVTNHTGLTTEFDNNIDLLAEKSEVDLIKLFGPEHGVRGNIEAGDKVQDSRDKRTGLPVYSLYGDNKKPSSEMLDGLDVLLFDIQDIGVRFYTYISTLFYCMESCAENDIKFIVLDRLNPLGRKVEGSIRKKDFESFVGLYPLPHRHGMTAGELALWGRNKFNLKLDLDIVKLRGWQGQYFNQLNEFWVPPSPGIPHFNTALIYPITCILEGTNISEGRGTANPFEYIGAPWIDPYLLKEEISKNNLEGIKFRPVFFKPAFSKHKNKDCGGLQLFVSDRNKLDTYLTSLTIIKIIFDLYPDRTDWLKIGSENKYFVDLLMGDNSPRKKLENGLSPQDIINSWNKEKKEFIKERKQFLLY